MSDMDARAPGAGNAGAGARDPEAVSQFAEELTFALAGMGFPRMPARVFVALLMTDSGRLSAAEISETLKASPAAVSGAVRYLMQIGVAQRATEPGSRRHYYRAPDDWWDEVGKIRDRLLGHTAAVMYRGAAILGAGSPAGTRIAESAQFFEFLGSQLPEVTRRWQEHRARLDSGADRAR
jgi:predicted transcriptional regulator